MSVLFPASQKSELSKLWNEKRKAVTTAPSGVTSDFPTLLGLAGRMGLSYWISDEAIGFFNVLFVRSQIFCKC